MKFTRKKGHEGTIRKVWSEDKKTAYGLVGTVGDLLEEGLLRWTDFPRETWLYLPAPDGGKGKPWFGATREDALAGIEH